jgi:hypothetical protein
VQNTLFMYFPLYFLNALHLNMCMSLSEICLLNPNYFLKASSEIKLPLVASYCCWRQYQCQKKLTFSQFYHLYCFHHHLHHHIATTNIATATSSHITSLNFLHFPHFPLLNCKTKSVLNPA